MSVVAAVLVALVLLAAPAPAASPVIGVDFRTFSVSGATPLTSDVSDAAPPTPDYGVLDTRCEPERTAVDRRIGVTVAVVEAQWDRAEPAAGAVDEAYLRDLAGVVTRCADAGLRVVVGSGMQYPPAWVAGLPGGTLRDQNGAVPHAGAVDGVFSEAVRAAGDAWLHRLVAALPAGRVDAVRLGTSAAGEIGYPGPEGGALSWWAFGAAAQGGPGLARHQSPTPMPGWIPGQATWNGRAVTADAARDWFAWYTRSLAIGVGNQALALRDAGFRGGIHLPVPGKGVLPGDLDIAVAARLDGTGDRDGSLGRGLDYRSQLALLAGLPAPLRAGLVVDLTSVDDASAVRARRVGQDRCTPGDTADAVPTETLATWANTRYVRAVAARLGLPVVGENPGPPGPTTGGVTDSDPEIEQVRRAPDYARACGLATFLLAFDDDLHTGRSGVRPEDYAAAIGGRP